MLGRQGLEVIGLSAAETTQEFETGCTFEENALLKARQYHRISGLTTIADDSGLEVEALGGAPGVFSARYAGDSADDDQRIRKLLAEMEEVPENLRQARFICAAAVVWDGGEQVLRDEVQGMILRDGRGENGFGYDPIFFYQPLGRTFAELTPSEKAEVSHRGRAFRRIGAWLKESGVLDTSRSGDRIVTTAD